MFVRKGVEQLIALVLGSCSNPRMHPYWAQLDT
jgi:hypothetical protein